MGKKVKRAIENVHGYGKFGQTTWNRLQGDGDKKKSGAGSVESADAVGGEAVEAGALSVDASVGGEEDGALSEARNKRRRGTLVGEGPEVFNGSYGTLGG